MLHEKNSRVSLCVMEFHHPPNFPWILAAIPVCGNNTGLTVPVRDLDFFWFWDFGWSMQQLFWQRFWCFRRIRVSPYLPIHTFTWHDCWRWFEWSISVEDVTGVKVDELEEDVGWSMSDPEEFDKKRTKIGTKFSVFHCIRIPFKWDVVFDWSSIRMCIRVHRKAFLAIKLLAYPWGLLLSGIFPTLRHKLRPLLSNALHHWLLQPSSDLLMS